MTSFFCINSESMDNFLVKDILQKTSILTSINMSFQKCIKLAPKC